MTQENVMHAAHAAGRGSSGETELVNELVALASLLYRGALEAQADCRTGVRWLPAGVLMEQFVADLTIVYSLPKVGGTTVSATLTRHPAVCPEPLHLHHLSPNGLAALEGLIAGCKHPNARHLRAQVAQGRGARALLAANRALRARGMSEFVRKPFLIAGVRDPIAQAVSLAFESWWLFVDRPEALGVEFLRPWVLESVRGVVDNWFTAELGAVFGVDVYARPFPTERGWEIYETDTARALVVRQESLDRLPEALGTLYRLDPGTFAVETCNVAADKEYAGHYAAVKRTLRLSESELDRVYDSRAVRHFYTAEEIAGFRRRWGAGRRDTENPPLPVAPKLAPANPEPTCGRDAAPHIWVCRPCWRCEQQLHSIPGLQHDRAEQVARVQQLEAEVRARAAHPPAGFVARMLRALARRVIRFGRAA